MTSRERDELLINMDKTQALMLQQLGSIEQQVSKTNGRVNDIEQKRLPPLEHHKTRVITTVRNLLIICSAAGVAAGIAATIYSSKNDDAKTTRIQTEVSGRSTEIGR